jgi:hypothetical protein
LHAKYRIKGSKAGGVLKLRASYKSDGSMAHHLQEEVTELEMEELEMEKLERGKLK